MISLSQTRYGSAASPGAARHGRSRRWRSYQARSLAASGQAANRSLVRIDDMNREQHETADGTVPRAAGEDERRPGLRAAGIAASRLAGPIVARHGGGALARLKVDWPAVVGTDLAAATWPQAMSRDGVLKLRVVAALALELQHRAPLLIERINLYLGRAAISRIALVQGPLPLTPPLRSEASPPVSEDAVREIDQQVAGIADSELRAALARLGKSVASGAPRHR